MPNAQKTKLIRTTKDHFYICPGHLKDRGFCSPIISEVEVAAKKKKKEEDLEKEIEAVKKEYEEKVKKKKKDKKKKQKEEEEEGKSKKKESKGKESAKDDNDDDDNDKAVTAAATKERDEKVRFVFYVSSLASLPVCQIHTYIFVKRSIHLLTFFILVFTTTDKSPYRRRSSIDQHHQHINIDHQRRNSSNILITKVIITYFLPPFPLAPLRPPRFRGPQTISHTHIL